MRELIKQLLSKLACKHKWESYNINNTWDSKISDIRPVKIEETLICQECGKIKKITL